MKKKMLMSEEAEQMNGPKEQDETDARSPQRIFDEKVLLSTMDLLKIIGIGRTAFDRLKKTTNFPKPLWLNSRRPKWKKSEIEEWMNSSGNPHPYQWKKKNETAEITLNN